MAMHHPQVMCGTAVRPKNPAPLFATYTRDSVVNIIVQPGAAAEETLKPSKEVKKKKAFVCLDFSGSMSNEYCALQEFMSTLCENHCGSDDMHICMYATNAVMKTVTEIEQMEGQDGFAFNYANVNSEIGCGTKFAPVFNLVNAKVLKVEDDAAVEVLFLTDGHATDKYQHLASQCAATAAKTGGKLKDHPLQLGEKRGAFP